MINYANSNVQLKYFKMNRLYFICHLFTVTIEVIVNTIIMSNLIIRLFKLPFNYCFFFSEDIRGSFTKQSNILNY